MATMANEPKQARKKRPDAGKRQNAQGEHEGAAHSPEGFDVMNPQKQGLGEGKPGRRSKAASGDR
jgi:hypothetical protein